ncbi:flagellar motor switch protein FliM [Bacillus sp. Brlt_9]|uniref:flagellar motor switch protein FliM n=1 Tax=Bacillus sp. Brlt_9 TaxID=3110916 RepID=UPI003F7B4792
MGNKKEQSYSLYDFDRPDKFSFENLRSLDSILTVFARNYATDLSGFLRMPTEIEVKKVDQLPFASEYLEKKEKDEHIFCVTNIDDKEQIIIQFDVGFLLRVHAKQTGGRFGKIEKVKKSITEFEKITAEHLIENHLYPPLQEAFKNVWDFEYSIYTTETDPQYAKITLPQDMVAVITFDVRIGTEYSTMEIVIPYLSIESYIERLNTDNVLKNRKTETPAEQIFYLRDHLLQLEGNLEVELGTISLTVEELLSLEKGDTLILNPIDQPVKCKFGGKDKFIGKIGSKEGKAAVKIIGMAKEVEGKEEKIQKVKEKFIEEPTKDS